MKTLIAVLGVAILGVTIICPLGCARHNKTETFSNYGFSFEYPKGYQVHEVGTYDGEANTDLSGQIRVTKETGGASADRVLPTWRSGLTRPLISDELLQDHFGAELAGYRQIWAEDNYDSVLVGETVQEDCSGHEMLYVCFSFTLPDGESDQGTFAEMYCDKSGRLFQFTSAGPFTGSRADAVDFLRVFTSSFVCH